MIDVPTPDAWTPPELKLSSAVSVTAPGSLCRLDPRFISFHGWRDPLAYFGGTSHAATPADSMNRLSISLVISA